MATRPAERRRQFLGLIAGVGGILLIALVAGPFDDPVTRATEAVVLILPVVVSAIIGGRWIAYGVSALAALGFALLIEPVGSPLVARPADLVALLVFAGVSVIVSFLVTRHIEVFGRTDHQRQVLLRSVSHDLRTPLSVIRGASSELLDGAGYQDEQSRQRLLQLVEDESERLDRLVANLLSLSRIEAGALRPDRQSVDVRELIDELSKRRERLFVDLELQVDIAEDVPTIQVDYLLMDQVLSNLLENAARHSPPEGIVLVTGRLVEREVVRIEVSDSGPGVDPADARQIFEPFRSGHMGGTSGIGLAICRAVVEAHGGTISVNGRPGAGATFVITLRAR